MADNLVELVKTTAWPATTLLGGTLIAFVFRKPISELLSRATSVSKEGLKVAPPVVPANQDLIKPPDMSDLFVPFDSQIMPKAELLIIQELQQRNLSSDGDTCKVLVKQLASANIQLAFERIHRRIFGSQFLLLKRLNERRLTGLECDYIVQYFDSLKREETYFDDWDADVFMQFLINEHLVLPEDERYIITEFGVEFLVYTAKVGLHEPRGL